MTRLKVYCGLTLPAPEVTARLPEAEVSTPVRRGDLLRDVASGVHVVVIIDGLFHHSLAVSCGELMDALRAGIRVYGASSMGALRASELDVHGMIGFGRVYELVRRSPFFRDDFVAQTLSMESGQALSHAWVDLHFRLAELAHSRRVNPRDVPRVERLLRELHYSERSPAALRHLQQRQPRLRAILERLSVPFESQKRKDALGVLQRCAKDLERIRALNAALNAPSQPRSHTGAASSRRRGTPAPRAPRPTRG
jgi:hypothetical protein